MTNTIKNHEKTKDLISLKCLKIKYQQALITIL